MAHTNVSSSQIPESEVITVEQHGRVAQVWLDRPDKLNAMGPDFWVDLPAVIEALGVDADVRAIVILGKGRAFTVGLDLVAFGPSIASGNLGADGSEASEAAQRAALYRQIKRMQHTFTSVADCPKPVIAAVHGYCLGGGIDLITACDVRLASADASFSVRETKLAMVADVGTLQRLPRIIDPGRVAELVYTGRDFDAAEALQMGLVTHVYPDRESLEAAAMEMASSIAANSPLAVQGAKSVLRAGEGRSIGEALDYVALWNSTFLHSNDLLEAIQAHLENRSPRFTGE